MQVPLEQILAWNDHLLWKLLKAFFISDQMANEHHMIPYSVLFHDQEIPDVAALLCCYQEITQRTLGTKEIWETSLHV